VRADGAELPLRGGPDTPARVRVRVFDEITVSLFLHVVRNDDGTHPAGVTLDGIVAGLNAALDAANRIYRQACIRFRMRQRAGTAPRDAGYTAADLEIDFIDETDLLDVSATWDPVTGAVTSAERFDVFNHGGTNRNTANPTFVNIYVIERFDGGGGLQGIGEANQLLVVRSALNGGTLFSHELGHTLNLGDLQPVVTDIEQRLMRSAFPRGELLASGGVAGDEITTARTRAPTYTGL
jgi:hypothetical protein